MHAVFVKAVAVSGAALVVVACGGGGGGHASTAASARTVQSCEALCNKRKDCSSMAAADSEPCKARCTSSEAVRKVEALRPEVGEQIMGCITANACDADLAAVGKRCVVEVVGKVAASPKVKTLCAKLEDAFSSCQQLNWKAACNDELKLFADEDLDVFGDCIDRSCKSGTACFRETEHALLTKRR